MTKKIVNEDLRNEIYPMCLKLMKKGMEMEAYIIILATWNFASFRYVMRNFNLSKFKKTLKMVKPLYRKLRNLNFKSVDLDRYSKEIKTIYKRLAIIDGIRYTGAPKLMHLKNPKLFVMWDNYIRKYYKYRKGDAEEYINFLKLMQDRFKNIKPHKGRTLARTIDEINFDKITKRILSA